MISQQSVFCTCLLIHITIQPGEAPLFRDMDLLTLRELELGSPEGFNGRCPVAVLGADGQKHDGLSDVHTCNCALWFFSIS